MIFFAGISPKMMMRVVFPYFLGFIAVVAVSAVYLYQTDRVYGEVIADQEARVLGITENLIRMSEDSALSVVMFSSQRENGVHYQQLRSDWLNCIDIRECTIAKPADETGFRSVPFESDTLAAIALNDGIPIIRRTGSGQNIKLTVFYPVLEGDQSPALVRMEFKGMMGTSWMNRYRYNFFVLAAAVIMLMIIPGLILKLADLRRKIEINGYFEEEPVNDFFRDTTAGKMPSDAYPSSLLDGCTSVALFKLDEDRTIVHMNSEAESLIDIPCRDALGLKFQELPSILASEKGAVEFPENGMDSEFSLNLTDSIGGVTPVKFKVESLEDSGYAVSAKREFMLMSKTVENVDTDLEDTGPPSGDGSSSGKSIQRAIHLAEEGMKLTRQDPEAVGQFDLIAKVLMDIRQKHPRMDLDKTHRIEIEEELDKIALALNEVLPQRASVEVEILDSLPDVECSSSDLTQIVKNMVFYSLESIAGPVRITVTAREVPSPFTDSVFSAKCDRSVPRSVSVSYCDGTRIPVLLKEALLDPETDTSGIQRDFGSHISFVSAVLANLETYPVFTEGSMGTSLNVLFRVSESSPFDVSNLESKLTIDIASMSIALCDASREVRDSISDFLASYGADVLSVSDLESLEEQSADFTPDCLILDISALEESLEETFDSLSIRWPGITIVFTSGSTDDQSVQGLDRNRGIVGLKKPYSPANLLDIIEILRISHTADPDTQDDKEGIQ